MGTQDFDLVFKELKGGLQAPLAGMGTAFSSSLFGLGGSLVLGFLDIQASHAQNRFFNGLEEWLSGVTQLIDEPGAATPEELEAETEGVAGQVPDRLGLLIEEIRAERQVLQELLNQRAPGSDESRVSRPD